MPSRRDGPPDPLGKRALFWVPQGTDGAAEAALAEEEIPEDAPYRVAPLLHEAETPVTQEDGRFVVVCQRCETTSVIGTRELLMFQFPVGVWLPRGRFDRRMTCPSCHKRAWCSVSLRRH